MPRPRFQNLAEEKRLALLEAAAKEFAEFGYEQASLNRILEAAGMSKGAAYYYFDDKADIFVTTIRYFVDMLFVKATAHLMELSAENFWPSFQAVYTEHLLVNTMQESWRFGIARALFSLSQEHRNHPEIQATFAQINEWVERLIEHGQTIGVMRKDLPKGLLLSLAIGVDTSIDGWFAEYGVNLGEQEREATARQAALVMKQVLAPEGM